MNRLSQTIRPAASAGLVSMCQYYRIRLSSSGLRSARVAMRKRFGQHLLTNPDTVRRIVECAEVKAHESVFEIGPGTGNLTMHLLQAANTVYAVELDEKLADILVSRVHKAATQLDAFPHAAASPLPRTGTTAPPASAASPSGSSAGSTTDGPLTPYIERLRLCRGDFLRTPLPPFHVVCANIPYQISSPVLRRLLGHAAALAQAGQREGPVGVTPLLSRIVLLLQLEFALRMVAKPGTADYCRLSVNTALLCSHASIPMRIGREQFRPPPKVDSAVIKLVPRVDLPEMPSGEGGGGGGGPLDLVQWDGLLRLAFQGKNKTLRASLCGNRHTLARLAKLRQGVKASVGVRATAAPSPGENGKGGAEEGAVVDTTAGPIPRALLDSTRADLIAACRAALGWQGEDANSGEGARPNGLTLQQYLALYSQLYRAGFRFVSPKELGMPALEAGGDEKQGEEGLRPTSSSTTNTGVRHDLGPVAVWDASVADRDTVERLYLTVGQHVDRMNAAPMASSTSSSGGGGTKRSLLLYPSPASSLSGRGKRANGNTLRSSPSRGGASKPTGPSPSSTPSSATASPSSGEMGLGMDADGRAEEEMVRAGRAKAEARRQAQAQAAVGSQRRTVTANGRQRSN